MYHISHWLPRRGMGSAGFNIQLFPLWKELVAKSDVTQEMADRAVKNHARLWLDTYGYDAKTHWEEEGERYLYDMRNIRVSWGEWGLEHISVPGNACGLDMESGRDSPLGAPPGGQLLFPHNVDSLQQASLLLTVFLCFADYLVMEYQMSLHDNPEKT